MTVAAPPELVTRNVYGAVSELFDVFDVEAWEEGAYLDEIKDEHRPAKERLIEGPAGTGKSHGVLEWVNAVCTTWAGVRILFLRQTRATLAESVLVEWEESILGLDHPAITGTADKKNRASYTYPEGWNPYTKQVGMSHIVLSGLDDPKKTFSTQYDIIILYEGIESSLESWLLMTRANRNNKMPFQCRIVETNPGPTRHWLNLRPDEDGSIMKRLMSRHKDNPAYWDHEVGDWTKFGREYVEGDLKNLPGAIKDRMYFGKWISEEGLVWPQFNRAVHCIEADAVPLQITSYVGSMDFGFRNPGSLNIWAIDTEKRAYRVAEVYKTGWIIDKWAEVICELDDEFPLSDIICDSARPDDIASINQRLGGKRGRNLSHIARPCSKKQDNGTRQLFGLDHVRDALDPKTGGGPAIFFVNQSLRYGQDRECAKRRMPTDTVQEIEAYSFHKHEDGKVDKESPNQSTGDHGCDNVRYLATWLWPRNVTRELATPKYGVGTFGREWNL
jgi:phage terminase large subunit